MLAHSARALRPGGQFILATHVGDEDVRRTQAYGDVPVSWTTYRWQPEPLVAMLCTAGLRPTAQLQLSPQDDAGRAVVLAAQRDE